MANDGKFILDGKRVKFSDYGGSSKETSMSDYDKEVLTASALLERLDSIERIAARRYELALRTEQRVSIIETDLGHVESDVDDMGNCYADVVPRLDAIELDIKVMGQVVTEEKIDGVDQEEDTFEELSNEEYLLADKICLEIKEYMSQFIDTDEKVVDNLCEIVMHRIVGGSDGID